jgi:pyridoxine 5-phosphate synthase
MTKLSVNVNKIALLRNSRGSNVPNVLQFSLDCLKCGADGITIHPRPDQRHIRYSDAYELKAALTPLGVELNIEGYPDERFLQMVLEVRPAQATLVPDKPGQLTSDHGWNCIGEQVFLREVVARLKAAGIRVSLFLDPDLAQVAAAAATGCDRIELYTQAYAESYPTAERDQVFAAYAATAVGAEKASLGINAGHDLSQENLAYLVQHIPGLEEVSIGHALIAEMLYQGMENTIHGYLKCLGR